MTKKPPVSLFTRRQFMVLGLGTAASLTLPVLVSCSSPTPQTTAVPATPGPKSSPPAMAS